MYRLPPGPRNRLRLLARSCKLPFVGRGAVLLCHRITEPGHDPWAQAVPPALFASHLAVPAERTTCLPLGEFLDGRNHGTLPKDATALTFDDGDADNLLEALPLLERYAIPATVFIMTGCVDGDHETWWDRLEQAVLAPPELPNTIELEIEGNAVAWTRPTGGVDHAARHALHPPLHDAPGSVDTGPREAGLAALWQQLGTRPRPRPGHRPLTAAE